jgi:hypothetical protein
MQKRQGVIWFVGAWLNPALVVLLISLLCGPAGAWAGELTGTGTLLENADGIRLQPPLSLLSDSFPRRGDSSPTDVDTLDMVSIAHLGPFTFNSIVTGLILNPERSDSASTTEGLTSLMAKRTLSLWAGRPDLGVIFNGADFIRLESKWLNDLSLTSAPKEVKNTSMLSSQDPLRLKLNVLRANLDRKTFLLGTKYKLTQTWNAGVSVPIRPIRTGLAVREILRRDGGFPKLVQNFRPRSNSPMPAGSGEGMGMGDITLHTGYSLLQQPSRWPEIAIGGQVKLPSKDNFLGTGEPTARTYLTAHQSFGQLTSYADLGFSWATEDFTQNSLSYTAGLATQVHPNLTLALDTWGYWIPNWNGSGNYAASLILGATWNPLRILSLYSDVTLPMNRIPDVPPEIIWTLSVKYVF